VDVKRGRRAPEVFRAVLFGPWNLAGLYWTASPLCERRRWLFPHEGDDEDEDNHDGMRRLAMVMLNPYELKYIRSGRLLIVLLLLFVPVAWVTGVVCMKVFDSEAGFFISAGLFFAALISLSVSRFVAFYRWKGKYPFDWLRR